ncbi:MULTISPECIES: hypothetical protein [Alteromonadaceae]|uniref:hypothetical protein n=1 Tax=Alteromonadaceae TaxID=72275 RepID=UPI001C0A3245|nr:MULTISPECIES: hypothetical protein [unclassified Aliiglaciecola]MBU2878749.1 hypothetical protein [Aliiglaciecola lipolytica]MDO6711353.1 hypothetical protein [Aliiglaciecola sp. 2_MG-2023]MDO6752198.1 hypothetical protein [Aliiglaciecola sp. 1_MG-2023]
MNIENFINNKAGQLAFFVRGYWSYKIPYIELDLYFWDTLEEWAHVKKRVDEPYSQKERVFWHLLHQLNYWPEQKLLHDQYLRSELETCLNYLEGEGQYPLDCIGIRP